MERNPHAINLESNPYQIELTGNEHTDSSGHSHEYHAYLPSRASISRQGRALVKGVQDRGGCRLTICLIGVTLCWLSSLQVAAAFVEILFTPPNGGPQVQKSWKQFGEQVNIERLRNLECISSNLGVCQGGLKTTFDSMAFSVEVVALQNSYLIGNATAYQQRCGDEQTYKIRAIRKYKLALVNNATSGPLSIIWNNTCAPDLIATLTTLYSDPAEATNQATILTTRYGNKNEVTWEQAYISMEERAAYDAAYWANKTQQLQDWYTSQGLGLNIPSIPNFTTSFDGFGTDLSQYWACTTVSNMTCPFPGGLKERAQATMAEYQTKYDSMTTSFYQQKNASQVYLAQAADRVRNYTSYADQVSMSLADVRATVQKLKDDGCGGACAAQVDVLIASFPSVPSVYLNVPDVSGYNLAAFEGVNWTDIMSGLDFGNETAAIRDKLGNMTFQMNSLGVVWNDTINTNVLNQFSWNASFGANFGYNPPGVNIDFANVSNITSSYVSKTNGQLTDAAARLSPGDSSVSNGTSSLRNFSFSANSLSSNDYSYASLGGSLDIDLWFFSVNWFRFFTYFFDYAWRIWYSGRIFMRYWFGAAGTMAPIDIRSYRTTKATPLHIRLARAITHPFVFFAVGLVLAVLVVSVILGIYVPMLNEYIETCVKPDVAGAPSFIGDNVYSAAFNSAVLQGNRQLSEGLNEYDTGRANLCGTTQQNANDAFAHQEYQLKIVRDNFLDVANLLTDMELCTSDDTWTQLNESFVFYTNWPNPTRPWHIVNCTLAGFDALGYLERPPINCTELPQCATQCGVDVALVQGVSRKASCQTEWYVHTTILQTVATIVVFLFWNICRTLLLDGLVLIYWKHLVRGSGLNFYSTCNRNGQIDTDTEDQLAVAIKQSDAASRKQGFFYVAMSVLLNIPYIVFCVLLNIDIAYPY